jgi:hypothetical protein
MNREELMRMAEHEDAGVSVGGEPTDSNCSGCGAALAKENAWMEDGCPCNSPRGCNDGNQRISDWRSELLNETKAKLAEVERENKQLREQVAQGGPLNAERWTLDELLAQLEQWKGVASGQTCVSFANLCYGASSLWHQTHRENFRRIDRQPEALSRWVLEFDGSIKEDFPAQVLALLERFFTERNDLRTQLATAQAAQLAAETSLMECQAQAAAMREAWGRVAGFATCVSDQGKYRVEIAYPTLEQAQDAYGAMSEITEALGRELLAEVERLRGSAEPSADLP